MYIQLNYTQRLRVYVKGRIYTGFVYVAFVVNVWIFNDLRSFIDFSIVGCWDFEICAHWTT